jgi:uncharacterized protein YdhG (YjbR/CyaY superfamily)
MPANHTFNTIDEYIALCDPSVQNTLKELRQVIKSVAPDATEKISYQLPTFYLHGNLVHFAAFKHHIGFYPGSSGIEPFTERLHGYKLSKGTIQFPLDKPLPLELIKTIVMYRVDENIDNFLRKSAKK